MIRHSQSYQHRINIRRLHIAIEAEQDRLLQRAPDAARGFEYASAAVARAIGTWLLVGTRLS